MASAQLPAPTLTAAERDDIVARFGGTDEYLAAFTGWLYGEVERCYCGQSQPGVWDQYGIVHTVSECRFTDRLIIVNYHV